MHRGGLGQWTEVGSRSETPWSVSAMVDRTRFPAGGLEGGRAGALGEVILSDGTRPNPKSVVALEPGQRVQLNGPGGGGYGDPLQRSPELVLDDVVNGYVSQEAAAREYGVTIRYVGPADRLVRTPDLYHIDWEATERLRHS
jgi:N-methylhydantoinase B